jgi:hypothetical protein
VAKRKTPISRAWRPLVAAAAAALVCAPPLARAQSAAYQLRSDVESEATPPLLGTIGADETPAASATQNPTGGAKTPPNGAQPPKRKPPASNLAPYRGADRAGLRGGIAAFDPAATPPPTVAALPQPTPAPKPKADDNPFDPTGVGLGDLRLKPYVEEDVGYSTNPNFVTGPTRGSWFETTDVGLGLRSDWSQNDLHAALHGGYTDFFSVPAANAPNAAGTIDGRYDISHDLSFDGEGRFNVATQQPGSVSLPTGVVLSSVQRPLFETYGATLGAVQKFGELSFSLHGLADRTTYQNARLADGSIDDLASDDFTDWALRGRVAYQLTPFFSPFVETIVDRRQYDDVADASGFERSSNGVLGRGGATLSLTNELTGELSGGYGEREYQDSRLAALAAPLLDASLIWNATALTKVTFKASTALADTTIAGSPGAVSRVYSIELDHSLRRYLTLGLTGSIETDKYVGIPQNDTFTNIGVKADYNITRDIMLRASMTRQVYLTNVPNSNYDADIFMLGLKLQR